MSSPLRIGFLGGIPPALGGGGLERQMRDTAAALDALGHEVTWLERTERRPPLDVVHGFGAEPNLWHVLRHAQDLPPLVVSPVVVVSPGPEERILRVAARLPVLTVARMRVEVLRRADAIVALTEYERRVLVGALGADARRVAVIANGSAALDSPPGTVPAAVPPGPFVLLVGAVSRRKRQAEIVRALAGTAPIVVAGGFSGSRQELAAWERLVDESATTWLGHVDDPGVVGALERAAAVLVHYSAAETQSLAVVEALSFGTPVVLSDIPSHRELAAAYPGFVRIARETEAIVPAVRASLDEPPATPPPAIPRWTDVAARLEAVYRRVLR